MEVGLSEQFYVSHWQDLCEGLLEYEIWEGEVVGLVGFRGWNGCSEIKGHVRFGVRVEGLGDE